MKSLLSYVIVACSITVQARAEVVTDPEIVCQLARSKGGAWLDTEGLRKCLRAMRELDTTEELLSMANDDVRLCNDSLRLRGDAQDACVKLSISLEDQIREREFILRGLREDLDAWYRDFWITGPICTAAGFVVGVLVVSLN